jgi:capsular polysaccharide biosynthesis protein
MEYGLYQTPKYEATAKVSMEQRLLPDGRPHPIPLALPPERLEKASQATATALDGPGVAQRVVGRLNLPKESTGELLKNMSAEQEPDVPVIDVTYTDTNPMRAQLVVNAAGQVVPDYVKGGSFMATQWEPAKLPDAPISPNPFRNGLITLAIGLVLSMVVIAIQRISTG